MTEISRIWSGTSIGDAGPYSDADWRELWESVTKNALNSSFNSIGYVAGTGSTTTSQPLKVTESTPNALSVDVAVGIAWFFGAYYENDAVETLAISTNLSGNPRIDAVCLTMDWTAQEIRLEVVDGTPAGSPVAPTLTQTKGTLWQHKLAEVTVANGAISITNANIDQTFNVPLQINDDTNREVTSGDAISTFNANWDGTLLSASPLNVVNYDDDSTMFVSPNNGDAWYPIGKLAFSNYIKPTATTFTTSSTSIVTIPTSAIAITPLKYTTIQVVWMARVEDPNNLKYYDIHINGGTGPYSGGVYYGSGVHSYSTYHLAYHDNSDVTVFMSFVIPNFEVGQTYTIAPAWKTNAGTISNVASSGWIFQAMEVPYGV